MRPAAWAGFYDLRRYKRGVSSLAWILLVVMVVVVGAPLLPLVLHRRLETVGTSIRPIHITLFGTYFSFAVIMLVIWLVLKRPHVPALPPSATSAETIYAADEVAVLPAWCVQTRTALAQLAEFGRGTISHERAGELLITAALWERIPKEQKRELARLLATAAACPSGNPEEETVAIREISSGGVLFQGTYPSL